METIEIINLKEANGHLKMKDTDALKEFLNEIGVQVYSLIRSKEEFMKRIDFFTLLSQKINGGNRV